MEDLREGGKGGACKKGKLLLGTPGGRDSSSVFQMVLSKRQRLEEGRDQRS
jgi:hypothetical protein